MAQIALPHQLVNGTAADATQVMANFNAIVDVVNGNLGSDNLGSISGADVTVTDLNGGTSILNNFTQRFQAGTVRFENIPRDETRETTINFPTSFPGAPIVFTSTNAGNPENVFTSSYSADGNGVTIVVRNNYGATISVTVPWLAVYTGAMN